MLEPGKREFSFCTIPKYIWTLPNTIVALLLAVISCCTGASVQCHEGIIEVVGGFFPCNCCCNTMIGYTLGHVIFYSSKEDIKFIRAHEKEHVLQYETFGVLFTPVWCLCALYVLFQCKCDNVYKNNYFEMQAENTNRLWHEWDRRRSAILPV